MSFPTGTAGRLIEAVVLSHQGARLFLDGAIQGTPVATLQEEARSEVRASVCMDGCEAPLLHHAAASNDTWAIRTLITLGANPHQPDAKGALALEWAARAGHREAFDLLLPHGVPGRPPIAAPTLVHSAIHAGLGFLKALAGGVMQWPVSIWNGWNEHGMRPLHCAVLRMDAGAAACLVGMGADARARNTHGDSPEDLFLSRFPGGHDQWRSFLGGQAQEEPGAGTSVLLRRKFMR